MKSKKSQKIILLFLLTMLALIVPFLLKNQYNILLAATVLMYGVIATSWNIMGGLAGQLDLASFAYLGLGAFTSATLLIQFNFTPWIGIILGGLISAIFALLVGIPFFRFKIKGVWYTLTTCVLVEILQAIFNIWEKVGGPVEKYLPYHSGSSLHMRFTSYIPYYYIFLVLLVLSLIVNQKIFHSKHGFYLRALGENEEAAEVLGVNTQVCKLKALVYYSFLVGITGGVYTIMYGYVHPSFFDSQESVKIAILGVVGGRGILHGPVLAALLLIGLQEILRARFGGVPGLYLLIYSIVLVLIILFEPGGIATIFKNIYKKFTITIGRAKNTDVN